MSQEKKQVESNETELISASEPAAEAPSVKESAAKPAKAKTATAPEKAKVTLILTGAGSYSDLDIGVGPFRKGQPFKIDADKADTLLKTGLFERA